MGGLVMKRLFQTTVKYGRNTLLVLIIAGLTGCYFFRKKGVDEVDGEDSNGSQDEVLGDSLGSKAGTANEADLENIYSITTTHAPAAIRPDPDVYVRRLLLQYRKEGATIAREIGRVENYRMLHGGASQDFVTSPQESYDATSLLANYKVAEEVCRGLVAPNANDHPGWKTILPGKPSETTRNIKFLAQRMIGLPTDRLDSGAISSLKDILKDARSGSSYSYSDYIPVCAALAIDAEALLL